MNNLKIKNQNGRSMIEMLGVLAIVGVLSVGGIAGYSKAMQKYRINKTIEQITLIAGNIRAFWGPQKNYIGVECMSGANGTCNASGCMGASGVDANGNPTYDNNGCPIVKKAKIFPDEMITVTDGKIMSITNPFGGRVSLYAADKAKDGDRQAFYIDYTIGDNEEACIELLTQDWSNANVSIVGSSDNMVFLDVPPLSVDEAITICEDEPTNKSLYFYFDADPSSEYWKETLEDCSVEKGGC
ncbi:MAG: hypothetical protein IJ525_04130 [Alphaproteobacteria bacterium]|nr:hypothetical protein [Alphaproteobacteria bacterium]